MWTKECTGVLTFSDWVCVHLLLIIVISTIIYYSKRSIDWNNTKHREVTKHTVNISIWHVFFLLRFFSFGQLMMIMNNMNSVGFNVMIIFGAMSEKCFLSFEIFHHWKRTNSMKSRSCLVATYKCYGSYNKQVKNYLKINFEMLSTTEMGKDRTGQTIYIQFGRRTIGVACHSSNGKHKPQRKHDTIQTQHLHCWESKRQTCDNIFEIIQTAY